MLNQFAFFDVIEAIDTLLSSSHKSTVNSLQQLGLYQQIIDHKYWQAAELLLSQPFLVATSKALKRVISNKEILFDF